MARDCTLELINIYVKQRFQSGERQELNYMVLETRIAAKGFNGKSVWRCRGLWLTLACAVTEGILKSGVTLFL